MKKNSLKDKLRVYMLDCEDASNLGGPMGSESTSHIFTEPYRTFEGAIARAERVSGRAARFVNDCGEWHWDAGAYIFSIKVQVVK